MRRFFSVSLVGGTVSLACGIGFLAGALLFNAPAASGDPGSVELRPICPSPCDNATCIGKKPCTCKYENGFNTCYPGNVIEPEGP